MRISSLSLLLIFLVISYDNVSGTTHYLLSNKTKAGSSTTVILFSSPQETVPTPLCVDSATSWSTLSLLAHHVCQTYGYSTYSHMAKHNTSLLSPGGQGVLQNSAVVCSQDVRGDYSISCSRRETSRSTCSLLEVTCGACYKHLQLRANSSLLLQSPLYPVLQPGLVCQWDLSLPVGHTASLQLQDLHLFPAHHDPNHGSQCVGSFLHLLAGDGPDHMASLATLCGDLQNPHNFFLGARNLKIQLVPGQLASVRGQRGFMVYVRVSSVLASKLEHNSRLILILGTTLGLLFMFGSLLVLLTHLASQSRKKRVMRPGRGATWHGAAPRPGQSLHQARTERMSRLVRDTRDLGNIYSGVGSRQLPDIPREREESDIREESGESSRIYESLRFGDDRDLSLVTQNIAFPVQVNLDIDLHSPSTISLSSVGSAKCSPVFNTSFLSHIHPSRPYCTTKGPLSPDYLSLLSYLSISDSTTKETGEMMKETRSVCSLPLCGPRQRLRTRLSTAGMWNTRLSSLVLQTQKDPEGDLLINCTWSSGDDVFEQSES